MLRRSVVPILIGIAAVAVTIAALTVTVAALAFTFGQARQWRAMGPGPQGQFGQQFGGGRFGAMPGGPGFGMPGYGMPGFGGQGAPGGANPGARPLLGVTVEAADGGLQVGVVMPGSAAAEAGVRPGDLIVKAAGKDVRDAAQLRDAVGAVKAGDQYDLVVKRDGAEQTLRVRRPESATMPRGPFRPGGGPGAQRGTSDVPRLDATPELAISFVPSMRALHIAA